MRIKMYGSCQLDAIGKILGIEEKDRITNWKYITSGKELPDLECDIFIYQPYKGENEYNTDIVLGDLRKKNKRLLEISVPFLNFGGYSPDFYIEKNKVKCEKYPYGRFPQGSSVLSGVKRVEELDISKNLEESFGKMRKIEEFCDIKIVDFVRENYKKERLFYSNNHCSNSVLYKITGEISVLCGIKELRKFESEMLRDHSVLILPRVREELGLEFEGKNKLYGGEEVDEEEYIRRYNGGDPD